MSKRKRTYLVIVVLFLCVCNSAFSQLNKDIALVSPAVTTFSKFGDVPVNLHTGIPSISIPIYELEVDGFTLPIGIAYHAGGVKVDEGASQVGLGWALIAGGLIIGSIYREKKLKGGKMNKVMLLSFLLLYMLWSCNAQHRINSTAHSCSQEYDSIMQRWVYTNVDKMLWKRLTTALKPHLLCGFFITK